MNRKGMEAWVMIGAVIALLVLAGGYIVLKNFYKEGSSWFDLVPSFKIWQKSTSIPEILAFDISDGRVYYYSGTEYLPKGGAVSGTEILNDKVVDMGRARGLFYYYYFDPTNQLNMRPVDKNRVIDGKKVFIFKIFSENILSSKGFDDWWDFLKPGGVLKGSSNELLGGLAVNRGDVALVVSSELGGERIYDLVVKQNGEVWKGDFAGGSIQEYRKISLDAETQKVVDFANEWKYSVLINPIFMPYTQKSDDKEIPVDDKYFCVKKIKPDYLVIYLDKPADSRYKPCT